MHIKFPKRYPPTQTRLPAIAMGCVKMVTVGGGGRGGARKMLVKERESEGMERKASVRER